ncbi:hypothetical protein ACFLVS_05705 [Chloroflexota bacterium]
MATQAKTITRVLHGNAAAAHGVLLCRPDLVAAYPVTPQTELLETLYGFSAQGLLDAEMMAVEGENSAISALIGASAAGGRTFTATSSPGLAFMADAYFYVAGLRLPVVMALVTREHASPGIVARGHQDAILFKDHGWIQIFVETCQEILDSMVMAYRLAEDIEVLVPVNICYESHYLSHMSQPVEIPEQSTVDAFLAPLQKNERVRLCLEQPLTLCSYTPSPLFDEYRYKHCAACQCAKGKLDEIDKEFATYFGRSYGGQIEEYRTEDAEIVMVTMGSSTGTARVVVDEKRNQGLKIGLIKVRMFRPFPRERLAKALKGKDAIGVIDINVCFGWQCGHLFLELKANLGDLKATPPLLDFIGGLAGADITMKDIKRAVDTTIAAADGKPYQEVTWLALE